MEAATQQCIVYGPPRQDIFEMMITDDPLGALFKAACSSGEKRSLICGSLAACADFSIPWRLRQIYDSLSVLILSKKLKNVSCEYDRLNG